MDYVPGINYALGCDQVYWDIPQCPTTICEDRKFDLIAPASNLLIVANALGLDLLGDSKIERSISGIGNLPAQDV